MNTYGQIWLTNISTTLARRLPIQAAQKMLTLCQVYISKTPKYLFSLMVHFLVCASLLCRRLSLYDPAVAADWVH